MKKSFPPPPACGITGIGVFIGGLCGMGGCIGIGGGAGAAGGCPVGGTIGPGPPPTIGIGGTGACPPIIGGGCAGADRLMMMGRTGIVASV